MIQRIPVYVLGGGTNGLGVVRNLGRNGISVHNVTERKERVAHSKYVKKTYIISNVEHDLSVLRSFFEDEERKNIGGVIFPTSDTFALNLSKLKNELIAYHVPTASYAVVQKLVDKRLFYNSLINLDVPHPKTFFPTTLSDAEKIADQVLYPTFLKPINSQQFACKYGGKKGFIVNNKNELLEKYQLTLSNHIEIMIQEIIPGLDAKNVYGIEGYFDGNSNPKAVFAHLRVRGWPPNFGNTCLRESIPLQEVTQQVEITIKYLRSIKFQGVMEAEWKKDPRDGSLKLLEINARQSMQNLLPTACGINLMLIAYKDAIGEDIPPITSYKAGIKWADFLTDLASAYKTSVSFSNYLKSLRRPIVWSNFAIDDSFPWLISNIETTKEILKKVHI